MSPIKARLLKLRDAYRSSQEVLPPWEDPQSPPVPILKGHTTIFLTVIEQSSSMVRWGACERMSKGFGVQYWGTAQSVPEAVGKAIANAPAAEKVCVVVDQPSLYLECSQRLWSRLENKKASPAWADLSEVIQKRNATFALACNGKSEFRDRANDLAQGAAACQPSPAPIPSLPKLILRKR